MPGENPSERVHGAGSVGFPPCVGSVFGPNCTWWPVGVVASSASHTFDGNGRPHCCGTSGSQPSVASVSVGGADEHAPTHAQNQSEATAKLRIRRSYRQARRRTTEVRQNAAGKNIAAARARFYAASMAKSA